MVTRIYYQYYQKTFLRNDQKNKHGRNGDYT